MRFSDLFDCMEKYFDFVRVYIIYVQAGPISLRLNERFNCLDTRLCN